MNITALRAEIAAHPAASDAALLAILRAPEAVWVDVEIGAVEGLCREATIVSRVEDAVAASVTPSLPRTVGMEFLGMLGGKMQRIEMSNPGKRGNVQAMLGAMQAVGWISAEEVAAILALAKEERPRAAVIGCDLLLAMDDGSALAAIAAARVNGG